MPALVHNSFRISNAKQFKESFHELAEHGISGFIPNSALVANTSTGELEVPAAGLSQSVLNQIPSYALDDQMYLFIGRVTPWTEFDTPDGTVDPNINENNPPFPVDSVKHGNFDHWDDMIAAKKVNGTDVSHVIKRERPLNIQAGTRGWEAGQRFDQYDDRSDIIFDDDMMLHAINERFRVYKCMKTGLGRFKQITGTGNVNLDGTWVWDYRSYDEPLTKATGGNISDDYLVAGNDGYQWKYFYTISAGEALKFVTTSYIPVRTVRKENGIRVNDFSDQYEIEENAIDGAILNVIVDKTPVVNASEILGYEPLGGDGYYQFAANATMTYNTSSSNTMSFSFADTMIQDCLFPSVSGGAAGANNIFDFTSGNAASQLTTAGAFEGYGVIVTNNADFTQYVYPIKTYSYNAGTIDIVVDDDFIGNIKGSGIPVDNTSYQVDIEIHPWIAIESNYDSSSSQGVVDRLQAYCIVEPFFDAGTGQYKETDAGRIIDVKVLNGGNNHFRIDSTMVMPDISANATPATVHASVAPVGGHGFDPVAELGGYNVMINARFEGSESNEFTVGNEFRKIGILKNPLKWDATNLWMGASNYTELFRGVKNDQCYRINLAGDSTNSANTLQVVNYQPDMVVEFKQNTAPYTTFATATLVDHDDSLKRIRVIEPRGDFATVLAGGDFIVESNTLHSVVGNTILSYTDALNTANTPGMKPGSGNILYIENRSIVSRSPNQSEDLKISISW